MKYFLIIWLEVPLYGRSKCKKEEFITYGARPVCLIYHKRPNYIWPVKITVVYRSTAEGLHRPVKV